jgi:hypothetical protein
MKTKAKSSAINKSIKPIAKGDTGLTVSMGDNWLELGEMWVVLSDTNGKDAQIIVSASKTATQARKRAISKLKKVIQVLEDMDS